MRSAVYAMFGARQVCSHQRQVEQEQARQKSDESAHVDLEV
jgi:hypothetical protein